MPYFKNHRTLQAMLELKYRNNILNWVHVQKSDHLNESHVKFDYNN